MYINKPVYFSGFVRVTRAFKIKKTRWSLENVSKLASETDVKHLIPYKTFAVSEIRGSCAAGNLITKSVSARKDDGTGVVR